MIVYVFYAALAGGVVGSCTKAAGWIRQPQHWAWLKQVWAEYGIELRDNGPCRRTLANGLKAIRPHVPAMAEELRQTTLELAQMIGICVDGDDTSASPNRRNTVVADGTVPATRIKKSTYQKRLENPRLKKDGTPYSLPDARKHVEGGGHEVLGEKFVLLEARLSDERNTRVILDVRPCPSSTPGGEAAVATEAILDLRHKTKKLHSAIYDGAFHSVNIDPLVKAGMIVISPPHKGTTKPRFLRKLTKCQCGGTHDLWTVRGALCVQEITDTGDINYTMLPERKVTFNADVNDYRCYLSARLPCGWLHMERLDSTRADAKTKFKRTEHLRQHPPVTPEYKDKYGWRSDTESTHSNLDRILYNNRMIVDNVIDQQTILIGHAIARNAITRTTWLVRNAGGTAAAAA